MQDSVQLTYKNQIMRGMEHYPEDTQGPLPAVLINHGFTGHKGGAHRIHLHLSRLLEASGFAAIRYDFIGSGESDGTFDQMTLSSEIDQAKVVYKSMLDDPRIDSQKIYVLGHSMGGLVASCLCGDIAQDDTLTGPAGAILLAPAGNMLDVYDRSREEHGKLFREDGSIDHSGFLVSAAFGVDLHKTIPEIPGRVSAFKNPVIVIHGSEDEAVPIETGRKFASYYEQETLFYTIEGADHVFGNLEHEAQLFKEILSFVTSSYKE